MERELVNLALTAVGGPEGAIQWQSIIVHPTLMHAVCMYLYFYYAVEFHLCMVGIHITWPVIAAL